MLSGPSELLSLLEWIALRVSCSVMTKGREVRCLILLSVSLLSRWLEWFTVLVN